MVTHLTGKSDKSKATAPLGIPINHDHGINDFAKLFEEAEELFIIDCYSSCARVVFFINNEGDKCERLVNKRKTLHCQPLRKLALHHGELFVDSEFQKRKSLVEVKPPRWKNTPT